MRKWSKREIYLLADSQAKKSQVKRGRSTIDKIKERNVYAVFVDSKAAFDNIDKEKMWRLLEEKEINLKMIRRMEKIQRN